MAFWLRTVIEKGQLAYSGPGRDLTGEIWSWGLPEERGVLGEICIGQGWPTTLNHSRLKIRGRVKAPSHTWTESDPAGVQKRQTMSQDILITRGVQLIIN